MLNIPLWGIFIIYPYRVYVKLKIKQKLKFFCKTNDGKNNLLNFSLKNG